MEGGLNAKLGALVLCGGVVAVLASACDLPYECEIVPPGDVGAGYPTGSAGAGDFPSSGEEDEGGAEDVDSASLAMAGSCSPVHPCTEMYEKCEGKKGRCTREIDWGRTLCDYCREDCQDERPYRFSECYQCGFR